MIKSFCEDLPPLAGNQRPSMKTLATLFTTSVEPAAAEAEALTPRGFLEGERKCWLAAARQPAQRHVANRHDVRRDQIGANSSGFQSIADGS